MVGSGGILLKAKEEGLITEVKSALDLLIKHGARIGEPLYRRILTLAASRRGNREEIRLTVEGDKEFS